MRRTPVLIAVIAVLLAFTSTIVGYVAVVIGATVSAGATQDGFQATVSESRLFQIVVAIEGVVTLLWGALVIAGSSAVARRWRRPDHDFSDRRVARPVPVWATIAALGFAGNSMAWAAPLSALSGIGITGWILTIRGPATFVADLVVYVAVLTAVAIMVERAPARRHPR
jgi:hypothetical protein